jgi:hypothetical protein
MIRSVSEAIRFVDDHGIVMLASHATLPSLVTEIAGEPVRGSWWAHAHGKEIFNIASALEDYALVTKLVDGKVTFVAPRLFPALYRVISDPSFRASRPIDPASAKLLARVMKEGEVRAPEDKKARAVLERTMLVHSRQEHSGRGKHVTVLTTWDRWANDETRARASTLSLNDARAMFGDWLG